VEERLTSLCDTARLVHDMKYIRRTFLPVSKFPASTARGVTRLVGS